MTTRLLISVRNAEEAKIVADAASVGPDAGSIGHGKIGILDIKEPNRGPLGAADLDEIERIVAVAAGRLPVSVALGELREDPRRLAAVLPAGVRFAKVGLSEQADQPGWRVQLARAFESLPPTVQPVAVYYADGTACCPGLAEVLEAARELRCAALLVDTYDKTAGSVLEHLDADRLAELVDACAASGMLSVIAGGITLECVGRVLAAQPDFLGVRGAVCAGRRTGAIDAGQLDGVVARLSIA